MINPLESTLLAIGTVVGMQGGEASYSQSGAEEIPGNRSGGIRTAFNSGCKGVSQPIYCLIAYNLISTSWVVYHKILGAR